MFHDELKKNNNNMKSKGSMIQLGIPINKNFKSNNQES